jgi:hypothetical protein
MRGPMDSLVRWLIQQRLKDGRLPRGRIADVQHGLVDGECDGCGAIIAKDRHGVSAITVEGGVSFECPPSALAFGRARAERFKSFRSLTGAPWRQPA